MRVPGPRIGWWITYVACLCACSTAAQARQDVLLIFDEDNNLPGLAAINRSLRETLLAEFDGDVVFYSETLQLSRFKAPEHDALTADYLGRKYRDKDLDLVVAVMEPSLDFLLRHRETIVGGVPLVFCGLDSTDLEGKPVPANSTGVMMKRSFTQTLEDALRLEPATRNVFVVGGTSRFDRKIQD